jgi:hypothetical protein
LTAKKPQPMSAPLNFVMSLPFAFVFYGPAPNPSPQGGGANPEHRLVLREALRMWKTGAAV